MAGPDNAPGRLATSRADDEIERRLDGLESAEAYRALAEGVPAILYIDASDDDSTNLFTSPQVEALLGYTPEEWIARPELFVELLHPEDRERVLRLNAESNHTGEPFRCEYRLIARDGRTVWFRDEAAMVRTDAGAPLFWRGVMLDVTQGREAEERLQTSLEILRRTMQQRQALMARLEIVQEEERRRIAADLHDDPIQVMSAVDLRLQALAERTGESATRSGLEDVHAIVEQAIERLRSVLFELRPPELEEQGLIAALELYLKYVGSEAGFATTVRGRLASDPPNEVAAIAFRIAQEAVANVRKHAGASRVDLAVEDREGGVWLQVSDDGFDATRVQRPAPGHLGMSAMPERAEVVGGWCRIRSARGDGTVVECWLPFSADAPPGTERSA